MITQQQNIITTFFSQVKRKLAGTFLVVSAVVYSVLIIWLILVNKTFFFIIPLKCCWAMASPFSIYPYRRHVPATLIDTRPSRPTISSPICLCYDGYMNPWTQWAGIWAHWVHTAEMTSPALLEFSGFINMLSETYISTKPTVTGILYSTNNSRTPDKF